MTSAGAKGQDRYATLHLRGPARLEFENRIVRLRKKGLALLCYLGTEHVARREQLADLLWGHRSAAANLRVEVSRLRRSLAHAGLQGFDDREDPLRLPSQIRVEIKQGSGELMEGLEDLSLGFQDWLEAKRAEQEGPVYSGPVREELARSLADEIGNSGLPFVLILRGVPGCGRSDLTQQLARYLDLPFVGTHTNGERVVHYLSQDDLQDPAVLALLRRARNGLWVIKVSAFGEDPHSILELRSSSPPQRLRFVDLFPLSWLDARRQALGALSFREASAIYLATGGYPGYIREVLAVRPSGGFDGAIPVPQRLRAAYQLEARHLSLEARLAIERLSVHPGVFGPGLLDVLAAVPHLDELERRGWLALDGGWRFASDTARRVVYQGLKSGQRVRLHELAAGQCASEGNALCEAFHLGQIHEPVDTAELLAHLSPWCRHLIRQDEERQNQVTRSVEMSAGAELALLPVEGSPAEEANLFAHAKLPGDRKVIHSEWVLPTEPCLLRLQGRGYIEDWHGVGLSGSGVPLSVELSGRDRRQVVMANVDEPRAIPGLGLILPLDERVLWLYLQDFRRLRVSCNAESAVVELEMTLFRPIKQRSGDVHAYDLNAITAGRPAILSD